MKNLWDDGWLILIYGKGKVFIMHDTQRIIGNLISQCITLLFEVMFFCLVDIVPFDFNVVVSVCSWLNMVCSKRMKKLVLDCTMEEDSDSFDVCKSVLKWHVYLRIGITSSSKTDFLFSFPACATVTNIRIASSVLMTGHIDVLSACVGIFPSSKKR